jgi:phytoene synthase
MSSKVLEKQTPASPPNSQCNINPANSQSKSLSNNHPISKEDIDLAYEYCRQVSMKHAKTFYFGTKFLPKSKQNAVYAVYALCRYVDDLVDRAEDKLSRQRLTKEKIVELIETWKTDLEACYNGAYINNPIMIAWHDTLTQYNIPKNLPLELIEGVCMDLQFKGFETFDELYVYCYKVASVVGLMTSEIFGYKNQEALDYAIKLGIGMQLTNILRDVGEDIDRGRIYLPKEDFKRFNYTEEDLKAHTINDKFLEFMAFQIDRARKYYEESENGIPMLTPDSRFAVAISSTNYREILDAIEKNQYNIFTQRAYVPFTKKLLNMPKTWLRLKKI